ncbi:ATP-dependent DNA helicase MER3 [Batrachochytrium dendrobatidis]
MEDSKLDQNVFKENIPTQFIETDSFSNYTNEYPFDMNENVNLPITQTTRSNQLFKAEHSADPETFSPIADMSHMKLNLSSDTHSYFQNSFQGPNTQILFDSFAEFDPCHDSTTDDLDLNFTIESPNFFLPFQSSSDSTLKFNPEFHRLSPNHLIKNNFRKSSLDMRFQFDNTDPSQTESYRKVPLARANQVDARNLQPLCNYYADSKSLSPIQPFLPIMSQQKPSVKNPSHDLISTSQSLPHRFKSVISFETLNEVQSICFDLIFKSNSNAVISAPTGSGKTVMMELEHGGDQSKIVYISPTKALCNERVRDWQVKFKSVGLTCRELTGDTDYKQISEIQRSNIIVTTPEKWDIMTRKWRDHRHLMKMLRLVLLDEVHILKEPGRGATLEVIVSRMKAVHSEIYSLSTAEHVDSSNQDALKNVQEKYESRPIRILAVSATVPNINDIAEWLKNSDERPAELRVFGDEYRPVQLVRKVIGYPNNTNGSSFLFEQNLDFKLMELIQQYSSSKPTLVFCSTRKSAISAAGQLAKECKLISSSGFHPFTNGLEYKGGVEQHPDVSDKVLHDYMRERVAFHHGGLQYGDRQKVESLFSRGSIRVICTTSTLAVGVNLPAHLVIIKGTSQYINGEFRDYSDMDIEQMIGRAGRPQFDTTGISIIMTSLDKTEHFQKLISGREVIESSLHDNLIEHLNAEVVLGSISNRQSALKWLQSTFLYIRIRQNPIRYRLKNCSKDASKLSAETRLETMFLSNLEILEENAFVSMDASLKNIQASEFGKAMAKYYLMFNSVLAMVKLGRGALLQEMLSTLCKAQEFSSIRFHADKAHLNALNKHADVKFPIKGRISTINDKVNILLQAIHAKSWDTSKLLLKQLDSIGPQLARALLNGGISTFKQLQDASSFEIESLVNRNPPFGSKILESAASLPHLLMTVSQIQIYSQFQSNSEVELSVSLGLQNPDSVKVHSRRGHSICFFVAGTSSNQLLEYRSISINKLKSGESFFIKIGLENLNMAVDCVLFCEDYVGLNVSVRLTPQLPNAIHKAKIENNVSIAIPECIKVAPTNLTPEKYQSDSNVTKKRIEMKPCNHSCRDKAKCAHHCCKVGITWTQSLKRKQTLKKSKAKPNPLVNKSCTANLNNTSTIPHGYQSLQNTARKSNTSSNVHKLSTKNTANMAETEFDSDFESFELDGLINFTQDRMKDFEDGQDIAYTSKLQHEAVELQSRISLSDLIQFESEVEPNNQHLEMGQYLKKSKIVLEDPEQLMCEVSSTDLWTEHLKYTHPPGVEMPFHIKGTDTQHSQKEKQLHQIQQMQSSSKANPCLNPINDAYQNLFADVI